MGNSQAAKKKKQQEELKKLQENQKKISIAALFLQGQKMENIPITAKRIFLRRKGLTDQMIDQAFKRFEDKKKKQKQDKNKQGKKQQIKQEDNKNSQKKQ